MAEHKDATEGKYYRWSERIANYLTIELAFLLAIIPSMIGLFFLVDTIDNILLYAVFFVFMGPAFGAMVASIESLGSGRIQDFFSLIGENIGKILRKVFYCPCVSH